MGLLDFFKRGSDRDRFAREVQLAMQRQGESRPLHYDAADYSLRVGADPARPDGIVNLTNGLLAWLRTPKAERAAGVERFARAFTQAAPGSQALSDRLANLRPAVRDRAALEIAYLLQQAQFPDGKSSRIAARSLACDWRVCLAEDTPDALALVNESTLAEFGQPWEPLLARALDNLRLTSGAWRPIRERGVVISNMDDAYDTSRVLLPELWRGAGLKGRVVAMAPDRGLLMMAPADDETALAAMASIAYARTKDESRHVSGLAITRDLEDDTAPWVAFEPPARLAPLFARVARLQRAGAYEDQSQALEQWYEARGEDVFVAKPLLVSAEDGTHGDFDSIASWADGVDALLPECDRVAFSYPDRSVYEVPWTVVRSAAPELMQATDHYPPRFQVKNAPTRERLQAVGATRLK